MNKIGIICIISITLLAVVLAACATTQSEKKAAEGTYDGELNILMLSDAGRNGSYDQRLIGEWMGVYADELGPEFVISCGDLFHYEGIQSTRDPLLWSNFESIYSHGELQCPWYGVLGNHEYRGNTQAMMDYTEVSRRWNMPDRYYTFSVPLDDEVADSERVRFVFIDTTPLIGKYRAEQAKYPDVQLVDPDTEVRWIDSVLCASNEKWKIVVGHHPMYTYDEKDDCEQEDMRARLEEIFRRNSVDAYFCGHIHTFQHIRTGQDSIDYVVNTSASKQRAPQRGPLTSTPGRTPGSACSRSTKGPCTTRWSTAAASGNTRSNAANNNRLREPRDQTRKGAPQRSKGTNRRQGAPVLRHLLKPHKWRGTETAFRSLSIYFALPRASATRFTPNVQSKHRRQAAGARTAQESHRAAQPMSRRRIFRREPVPSDGGPVPFLSPAGHKETADRRASTLPSAVFHTGRAPAIRTPDGQRQDHSSPGSGEASSSARLLLAVTR